MPLSRRKRVLSRLVTGLARSSHRCFTSAAGAATSSGRPSGSTWKASLPSACDSYTPDTVWRKIRNGEYTQMRDGANLFTGNIDRQSSG